MLLYMVLRWLKIGLGEAISILNYLCIYPQPKIDFASIALLQSE
jgi:hypothetical protein